MLDASDIPQKEVVFLTDLQAASWRKPAPAADDGLKRAVAELEAQRPVGRSSTWARPAARTAPSPTCGSTRRSSPLGSPPLVHGDGPELRPGARPRASGSASWSTASSAPSSRSTCRSARTSPSPSSTTFDAPGDHVVEVQIDDDPLALDNQRWLAVPVRERLSVLLVDGDYKPEPFQSETDYLAQALSPASRPRRGSPSPIKVEVVAESQLSRRDLAPYDAVVLCNVAQFTEAEVAALEAYLKQGGGVVVFGGDQVSAENYNRLLFADGKGLLPASVGPERRRRREEGSLLRLRPAGLPAPDRRRVRRRVEPGRRPA